MRKYQFCAELGELYKYDNLNQLYGLDQKGEEWERFQEDTLYFIEKDRVMIEYWDNKKRSSIIFKDFLNLYDPIYYQLNEKNLKKFIKKYGLPLYTDRRDNRTFLGIEFPLQPAEEYPLGFYSCLKLEELQEFHFFLKTINDIIEIKSGDHGSEDLKMSIILMKLVHLLKSPFMKQIYDKDVLQNHIQEFDAYLWNKYVMKKCEKTNDTFMQVLKSYKKELKDRRKDYIEIGEDFSDTTQKFDLFERPKIILNFLNIIEKHIIFNKDMFCFIGNYAHKENIEEIFPLVVTDYLNYLIEDYDLVVVKDSESYHLQMQVDTYGAIILGLIYTIDAKRYLRKCPQCGKYFYPALTHPNQRCCGHTCSDLYGKLLRKRKKINSQINQLYWK